MRLGASRILSFVVGLVLVVSSSGVSARDWQGGDGFRSASLPVAPQGKPGFTRMLPTTTGITFTNLCPESLHLTNQIFLNGSGVAAGDMDGDGWCDLFFASVGGPCALYRNLGDWKFQDTTREAGVACEGIPATGAAFADLDGDGDLDLIVNSIGAGTHIFYNDGKGHFTRRFMLNEKKGGMSLALADIDGDGFLDLYITNYRPSGLMDMPNARAWFRRVGGKLAVDKIDGRPMTDPAFTNRFIVDERQGIQEQGEVDALYRNQGGTNFVAVSFTDGAFLDEDGKPLREPPYDWGLSAMFRDINRDGLPDLYVCNDFFSEDRFWLNLGGGRFQLCPRLTLRHTSLFSMGLDFADINRDGLDDFLVLDMLSRDHRQRMRQMGDPFPPLLTPGQIEDRPQYGLNMLFLNRGDGTFAEIAQLSGVDASEWSWMPIFLDVDLDGWEDLLVSTGNERAARDPDVVEQLRTLRKERQLSDAEIFQARKAFPRLATGVVAFRNRGDLTFEDVPASWGLDSKSVANGMALADLDNDGDLDLVVNYFHDAVGIYRNEASAPRVAVRLKGNAPNSTGIGARIRVTGGPVPQSQEIICGGRYLSSDQPMRVFAAGSAANRLTIEVIWRSGKQSVIRDALPHRAYEIAEAAATAPHQPSPINHQPFFTDVSDLLHHTHHDDPFDDFARQPLLPHRLSQLGPGVAWFDLDGDGWEDLIIAGGRAGRLAVFHNDGKGKFQRLEDAPLTQPIARDQTTVLGWRDPGGQALLLAGSANYEDGLTVGGAVRQFNLAAKTVEDAVPGQPSSTGPLALADVDGDGQLDLVVGGRVVPGRYPEPASSLVFRGTADKFVQDEENSQRLAQVGLVSGAVFSDLDGDGDPDLVLACDWGPLRLFRNEAGKLRPWEARLTWNNGGTITHQPSTINHQPFTIAHLTGWWTGVTTGDFDGDGQLDIVAANWGRNTRYERHRAQPLRIFYGDLDGDGTTDLVEAHFDRGLKQLVPDRSLDALAKALPFLRERFTPPWANRTYSESSVEEIFGDRLKTAKHWEAAWLESTVLLNRGDHFEARPLPIEAQMAPAFGVCVADLDGDGNEDIFLSQNFFAVQPETPRSDAGRGLLLRGDGKGGFAAVPGQASGIKVYGEQRGCAVCDYDQDGRADLVVTQNAAATKLFHNESAKPGLRVRLIGGSGNPSAVGAALRLIHVQRQGPLREIHAGSGYWSQDSAVQVLSRSEQPSGIWVRWPGGRITTAELAKEAQEIEVRPDAGVKVVR